MNSLKLQALRHVPHDQIKDIPVDVISELLDQYFSPSWIIKMTNELTASSDMIEDVNCIVYRAPSKKEAIRMFIRDGSLRYQSVPCIIEAIHYINKKENKFRKAHPEILNQIKVLMDQDLEFEAEAWQDLVNDNLEVFVDFLDTSKLYDFTVEPFKYGELY